MATIIVITDGGNVAGYERVPTTLKDAVVTGKKVVDVVRDAGNAVNPVTLADKISLVGVAIIEVERSPVLTTEERSAIRAQLLGFDPITDTVKFESRPGYYAQTHPTVDVPGPPTYVPITRVVDP